MRNLVFGTLGVLWGGGILVRTLLVGLQGEGAYFAGQVTALLFGVLLLGAGLYYLVDGIKTVRARPQKSKKRKRSRRAAERESEE